MKQIRIGAGAGYSGDRIEPAIELARHGDIRYLVFECLAERTIAIAQQARLKDPTHGYDPLLEARMNAVLPLCRANGIRLVTNMGAANPQAAAERTCAIARALGLRGLRVAAVSGDDVLALVTAGGYTLAETGATVASLGDRVISANAYLGAEPIVEALQAGADIVITGRVADPSLFVAPLVHEFGWAADDWATLGRATVVGHLLECAGQITGGYFADPGCKDVAGLARLGFPLAEVRADGSAVITKVAGSGGTVTLATCKEQLIYEVHDPARYLTPDVAADFTGVRFTAVGTDRVQVEGGDGRERTPTLKASIGYLDGWHGEGQMSYAGPGAVARGRLALEIVAERLALIGARFEEIRYDLIGVDAIHGRQLAIGSAEPYEVRARVAARTSSAEDAWRIANEVETLYTNGPAGGGGASRQVREIVAMGSTLVPRNAVTHQIRYEVT